MKLEAVDASLRRMSRVTVDEVIQFLRQHKLATCSSIGADGWPQAAVIGIAVTDDFELVFDTLSTTRKHANLTRDGRCALVVWHDAITLQIEGRADHLTGRELARYQTTYLAAFPDGHDRKLLPDITYWRVRPSWLRRSDFATQPPKIVELGFPLV